MHVPRKRSLALHMVGTGKFDVFTTRVSPLRNGWLSFPSKLTLASALLISVIHTYTCVALAILADGIQVTIPLNLVSSEM